jgi:hypothetical protein
LYEQGDVPVGLCYDSLQLSGIRHGMAIHGEHHVPRFNPGARCGTRRLFDDETATDMCLPAITRCQGAHR